DPAPGRGLLRGAGEAGNAVGPGRGRLDGRPAPDSPALSVLLRPTALVVSAGGQAPPLPAYRLRILTDPPLVRRWSLSPPEPSVPRKEPRENSPGPVSGRSLETEFPWASIARPTVGSTATVIPPPEDWRSPPCAFPREKLASIEPPDVSASTRPPASRTWIPPPEV